ncbi:5'-3' exoribonuclease 4 [Sarracenia purpurea var. burkii]
MQDEEQARNSVTLDLLYLHTYHPLAAQVMSCCRFLNQLAPHERYPWPIDTNASEGMNGYLWYSVRNGWRNVIPSPVSGLQDIEYNQTLNITYLNPPPHKHIPKPPIGIHMPGKILNPWDIKPSPVLWHEDNGGRRQKVKERPPVTGAISGLQLGEAAHRLLKNTLNLKPSHNYSGSMEQIPHRNSTSNHVNGRPRVVGSCGYERGFIEYPSSYNGNYNRPQATTGTSRSEFSSTYEMQSNKQNFQIQTRQEQRVVSPYKFQSNKQNLKMHDRYYSYQEQQQQQQHNLRTGMSALTIEESGTRPRAWPSPRMPNSGQFPNVRNQFMQSVGGPLPSPPPKWIRPPAGNNGLYSNKQHKSSAVIYEKQAKKIYQAKSQESPELV